MQQVELNELLEAGVHFGHQTRRWNPKMKGFIFTERNGIHIIDLRKTLDRLTRAQQAVREVVLKGERVLFVCTKRQLRGIVEQEAERSGSFYVTERWLGGMLTNFQTIRNQIRRLKELERGQEENAFEFYTKKERLLLDREREKLDKYFSGVKDMTRVPGAIFVVDARRETIAVKEAHRLNIPVIAITDTNADPDLIDYPIPGNDDAMRAVGLITKAIGDAVESARQEVPEGERRRVEQMEATTYSTETGETTEVEKVPARRRPRRKRRPRPEVIAQHRQGGQEDSDDATDELAEDAPAETEVAEATGADVEVVEPEAAAAPEAESDAPAAPEAAAPEAEASAEDVTEAEGKEGEEK
ncbi:MAG: 30S ribosomal protein S2 [Gemmatimonadetes bacterium]|nr:30S ribosomal protein S2 [Gemmatimonadota bacterium]NNM06313.1 30S ribosomal protein S2 [Gemmatimonadota bacterium]